MTDRRKCSSRQPASEKQRTWMQKLCNRDVLMGVIGVARTLVSLYSLWQRFKDDLWPFYWRYGGINHAT